MMLYKDIHLGTISLHKSALVLFFVITAQYRLGRISRNFISYKFNATEESVTNDVKYLIEWMRQEPSLPCVQDKDILVTFLIRGKFQLKRTKQAIERYYVTRALMPQVYRNRYIHDPDFQNVIKISPYVPMPKLTPDGYRVLCMKIRKHDDKDMFSEDALLRGHQMMADMLMKFDRHRGLIMVLDLKHMSFAFVRLMMLSFKKFVELAQRTSPLRIHKIYILNLVPIAETVVKLAKMVMKKKVFSRIQFWNGSDHELTTVIPKECLPVEYGGTEKSLQEIFDKFNEVFSTKADWLISEEAIKADLSKKTVDESFQNNEFGVDGSFRKISLD